MNIPEEIIKTALLGTDRYTPNEFGEIQPFVDKLTQKQDNKEATFLKSSFAYFLYEDAGKIPSKETHQPQICPAESLEYLPEKTASALKNCFDTKNDEMLFYIVRRCHQAHKIVPPELVISCIQKAITDKRVARIFMAISGQRAIWLCQLNPEWRKLLKFTYTKIRVNETIWEVGTLDQRLEFLAELRSKKPSEATQKLSEVITQEPADNRLSFLECLETNLSLEDEDFLMSLRNDRSQKVKKFILHLLLKIQGSYFNTLCINHVSQVLSIHKKKGLLNSKQEIAVDKSVIPSEELFSLGIEKVSSQKGFEDELYWLAQMLAYIHPNTLAKTTELEEMKLLELLMNGKEGKLLTPFIINCTINFRHHAWALALIEKYKSQDMRLLDMLSMDEIAQHCEIFITNSFERFVNYMLSREEKFISADIGSKIIAQTLKKPYSLSKAKFKDLAMQMDKNLLPALYESAKPKERQDNQVRHVQGHITDMIQVIEQRESLVF